MALKINLPGYISFLRMQSQLLFEKFKKNDVIDVIDHMFAMQAQSFYDIPKALLLRSKNTNLSDIYDLFDKKEIVRHRPMRGTLHISSAKDYHWMRLILNRNPSAYVRRKEIELCLSDEIYKEAYKVAAQDIADGFITRKELFSIWSEHFKREIQKCENEKSYLNNLMWAMDRKGLLIEGPIRNNQHCFIDAARLPKSDSKESSFIFSGDEASYDEAYCEVAYRYIKGHGPANISDLARWSGISRKISKKALEENVKKGRIKRYGIGDDGLIDLKEVKNSYDTYYALPGLYMGKVKFFEEYNNIMYLPRFDELYVGYENRSCLTDDEGENMICSAKNGSFIPIIIKGGRLTAVYPKSGIVWKNKEDSKFYNEFLEVYKALEKRLI